MDLPVIDIESAQSAPAWDDAMRRFGFALIEGHGINEALQQRLYDYAQDFFARPLDAKRKLSFPERGRGQGYLPLQSERVGTGRVANAAADLCESLTFANPRFDTAAPDNALDARLYRANLWPEDMPGFRETVEAYFAAGRALVDRLMWLSAGALGLPENHFAPFFDKMELNLRLVLYPDQAEPPPDGALRYGPHTDFSGFTVLRQDTAPGGLQVQCSEEWIDVKPVPGTLVINAGDLIQRWTNDRWISNIHRVTNPPPRGEAAGGGGARSTVQVRRAEGELTTRRLSIVLFTGPNSDAEIACLPGCGAAKYPPILAGVHSEQRMRQTYGTASP